MYGGQEVFPPPPPLWVGGACLYVHACIGVCMYLYASMYVCIYSLCVCMYTCNACCEASTQTYILLLSLLLGGPNPFGGGATKPEAGIIYISFVIFGGQEVGRRVFLKGIKSFKRQKHVWREPIAIIGTGHCGLRQAISY